MFGKILVANRGEIACRIMRTARRMGIATVAVHAEGEARAAHVLAADEACLIGPPQAALSYLDIDRIIAAARKTGAEAIHPGYGFLSENPAFVEACEAAGLTFIGPNARAMSLMGDKLRAKACARAAGVSTVPGAEGEVADVGAALAAAARIGYPVMIKAAAGGGGKGMRIARDEEELREGFAAARSEASSAFGDGRILVEKFIDNPRHVEVQILADRHGNVIHLGERECSIQRRNQKIVEEAPSPLLDEQARARMGTQAVALARAVGYDSAGTVEFVCGQDGSFHFLEMNTRLQVEHPVTEMITGLDLVELMIRIAAGEPLPLAQEDVRLSGWAVETRIYAEDPERGFLPSVGRIRRCLPPLQQDGEISVRIDSGVVEGQEITVHYDPMIAKLVTRAPDRQRAIAAQAEALDAFVIDGITHNIPFLSAIMNHPRWQAGRLSTAFVEEEFADGLAARQPDPELVADIRAIAAAIDHVQARRALACAPAEARQAPAREHVQADGQKSVLMGADAAQDGLSPLRRRVIWLPRERCAVSFAVRDAGAGRIILHMAEEGTERKVESDWRPGMPLWRGKIDGRPCCARVRHLPGAGLRISRHGLDLELFVCTPREAELAALMPRKAERSGSAALSCPMPGTVLSVSVAEGDAVKAGSPLCVIEAMKMENILRAERDGIVAAVHVAPGDTVCVDQVLMEFTPAS